MKVGITSNFTHIILYCILKVIGVVSAHSLVPPFKEMETIYLSPYFCRTGTGCKQASVHQRKLKSSD